MAEPTEDRDATESWFGPTVGTNPWAPPPKGDADAISTAAAAATTGDTAADPATDAAGHTHALVTYPEAQAPDRQYVIDADSIRIAVYEWGSVYAPALLLVHGGFDFARTFDVLAPKLAGGGWRVIGWDQRGHGDSEHAQLYSWDADIRDSIAVFDHVSGGRPVPVVGHSKGGAMMIQLADAQPFRFRQLVNLDGIPYKRPLPDVAEHERTRMLATDVAGWLDHRRAVTGAERRPGTLDDLARRRGRMNPRLSHEWLRYLVSVGAREDPDGWRWKIDPSMRFGGFGPWRPEWTITRLPGLAMPFLGILGSEVEEMSWGTLPQQVNPYLPAGSRCEMLDGVGHFVHIEQPDEAARRILDFVGAT